MSFCWIVSTWHVGESHADWRSVSAAVAPELGAVGQTNAQELIGVDIESITTCDNEDITVLSGDDPPGNPGSLRRVADHGDKDTARLWVDSC